MSKRLENKNIVVTAAGQGIGRATAIAFNNEGANVIATDINDKTLKTLNKEYPNIKVKNLDSTNKQTIEQFSASLDRVDVLFNAVGFVHHGTILDCEEKDWDFSFDVNIKSMYFMCRAILPLMIKQNGGSIINISSIASSLKGLPNRFVYGASKAAIISMSKSLALEYAKKNITVNCISPGYITTNMTDQINEKWKEIIKSKIPMDKFGLPKDVANTVIFLSSEAANYITGQTIHVNGGMYMA